MNKCLVFLIVLFSFTATAQNNNKKVGANKPDFFIGNLVYTRVNIDSFKLQKEITATRGYKFSRATVYFAGANFQNVIAITISGSSLSVMEHYINKCGAGSTVTFDNVALLNNKDSIVRVEGKVFVFYSGDYFPLPKKSTAILEMNELVRRNFVSGTVYFSGANFPSVATIQPLGMYSLDAFYDRCGPGCIIAFESCVYKNADGTLSKPITKLIKLE